MGVKVYKKTSPGRRFSSVNTYEEVTKTTPEKSLLRKLNKTGGRNHSGKTTVRFRGGGNKRMYRVIDFRRNKDGVDGKVAGIEYDPNRSCNIALIHYVDGEKRYILAPLGLKVGQMIVSGERVEPRVGNCMPLASIPPGLEIHNIEMNPGQGGKMVRSAGGVARLAAKEGKKAALILPSGEMRMVDIRCRATIGQLGNLDHGNVRLGKAGRRRHLGRRPHVRGVAMNPVAHPSVAAKAGQAGGVTPAARRANSPRAARRARSASPQTK